MNEQHGAKIALPNIGKSSVRVDGPAKVTGQALYPGDLTRPGMLHMKVLFAGRPHARILNLDTRRALAVPGVVVVLTARDVPVNEYGLAIYDQPVLCDEFVRFEGNQVALVIAETEKIAAQARDLIAVRYEDLPAVTDPRIAMGSDSPLVHAGRADNVLEHYRIRRGDTEKSLAQADVLVEENYFLPMQEHAYLQPEAGLAYMDGDVVVVETAGQWAHHDRRQIAHALNLPLERVRVIYRAIGGAFGGREDVSVQIVLALAALKTGRPVKIVWTREESVRGHCKRHQMFLSARWGATREGRIVAAESEVIVDAGAYAYTSTMVLGHTILTSTGVYDIPNVKADAYAVYTNNVPGGAFRGFGSPQGIFVAEQQMDRLADVLGLDPITIRERNLLRGGRLLSVGTPFPASIPLDRLLQTCAEAAGWRHVAGHWERQSSESCTRPGGKRGTGFAIGYKNVGFSFGFPEESTATIELHGEAEIEHAVVHFAGAECGQGIETLVYQMAAEALDLPLERVFVVGTDTQLSPEAGSASASRLTFMGGNAIIGAAQAALDKWRDEERPARATFTYHAPATSDFDDSTGYCQPHVAFSAVAQAVDVQVDEETGELVIPRVVTVLDAGRAINPQLIEGQVEGAVAQGIGYAVLENFITAEGRILTPDLSTYLIPTATDMPELIETHILENAEPNGPWGARGIGETPILGVAPALVSAVKDATGLWFDCLPLAPEAISQGLRGDLNVRAVQPVQIPVLANSLRKEE